MNKTFRIVRRFVLLVVLCIVAATSVFAAGTEATSDGSCFLPIIYSVVACLSLCSCWATVCCIPVRIGGFWHSVYFIYLFAYLAAMISAIAYAAVKK